MRDGFRNFLTSIEDFITHFCVRHYLCSAEERYHITDLSKGAMLVKHAGVARTQQYDRWYALLKQELDLLSCPGARVVRSAKQCPTTSSVEGSPSRSQKIIHYSGLAAHARRAAVVGREGEFEAFKDSVSLDDVLDNAESVLLWAGAPAAARTETLSRLAHNQLSVSRCQLIFNYKTAFESLRRNRV